MNDKITVTCPKHGQFEITARHHLNGHRCKLCAIEENSKRKLIDKKELIEQFNKKFGNKYDYSKVQDSLYLTDRIIVTCPKHGDFEVIARLHLQGVGCPKCLNRNKTTESFINELKEIYNNEFDYSKVNYINNKTKVCLICHKKDKNGQEHGEWWVRPNDLLTKKRMCEKCANEYIGWKRKHTFEQIVELGRNKHCNFYSYKKDKNKYGNNDSLTCICPKHGEFKTTVALHICGGGTCPRCKQSRLERNTMLILDALNIEYVMQYKQDWLKHLNSLYVDFYLPKYNIAIECQGEQHFKSVRYFGGEKEFQKIIDRDKMKKQLCEEHGIKVFYVIDENFKYNKYDVTLYNDANIMAINCLENFLTNFNLEN